MAKEKDGRDTYEEKWIGRHFHRMPTKGDEREKAIFNSCPIKSATGDAGWFELYGE